MAATSTATNSDQTMVGTSGTIYVGVPSLVTAPTAERSAVDADAVQLGFVSTDGVTFDPGSPEIQEFGAWQTQDTVRRVVTGRARSLTFALEQFNWLTIPFAMGGGTVSTVTAGHYKYIPPAAGVLDERSLILDWADGTRLHRIYVPRGIVTAVGEINLRRSEMGMLQITFGMNFDGTNDTFTWFSDDVAMAAS